MLNYESSVSQEQVPLMSAVLYYKVQYQFVAKFPTSSRTMEVSVGR